jgi:hypothetical protein
MCVSVCVCVCVRACVRERERERERERKVRGSFARVSPFLPHMGSGARTQALAASSFLTEPLS